MHTNAYVLRIALYASINPALSYRIFQQAVTEKNHGYACLAFQMHREIPDASEALRFHTS